MCDQEGGDVSEGQGRFSTGFSQHTPVWTNRTAVDKTVREAILAGMSKPCRDDKVRNLRWP